MSNTARKHDEWVGEVHHLSAAGPAGPRAAVAQTAVGPGGASPTPVVKRRRTRNVWLSPRQFAREFGVGTSAVYGAVERGEVPAIRVGRHIRIPLDSIERIIRNTANKP
jgi:excisionase family DNA binding protein